MKDIESRRKKKSQGDEMGMREHKRVREKRVKKVSEEREKARDSANMIKRGRSMERE